jgi:hypothetical protein
MKPETQSLAELQNIDARLRRTAGYLRGKLGEATRTMAALTDEIVTVEGMIESNAKLLQQRIAREAS